MKQTFALVFLLLVLAAPASARPATGLRRTASSGATIESFVPPSHVIEQKAEVDFDGDGLRDAALVIAPACEDQPDPRSEEDCRSEGRMLVIVFGVADGGYRLSASKAIGSTVGIHGDSFGGMKTKGRTLTFEGGAASCAGQTGAGASLTFRYQRGDWFLIGSTESTWHLSTECDGGRFDANRDFCPELKLPKAEVCVQVDRSANFSTSLMESTWSIEPAAGSAGKERSIVLREKLPRAPLRRLADVELAF